ncbi:hypothetical protein [Actinopolymorpha alba]|uniref:hypothetical protein n=1 Tax=Actinopolymorpha alba TaxID=533267 RepID=UPI000360C6B5|nr:hypothetical protein [Actinopolymorpha alba]
MYGSLLAASVVAGASAGGTPHPLDLAAAVLSTGLIFWVAHVYARLVGERGATAHPYRSRVRVVARREWPLVEAAIPPAFAALVGWSAGLSRDGVAWLALVVALVGQVSWAVAATVRARAPRPTVVASAFINLGLGLLIVLLEVIFLH